MLRIISLGAGVQSTTLALMAAAGEIEPMPDAAIFADTQWEPRAVYEHLARLRSGILPFPVHVVTAGNIRDNLLRSSTLTSRTRRFATAPWHIRNHDGSTGIGRRQCTKEFKIEPLQRKQRELLGYEPRRRIPAGSVEVWIGISVDEAWRMKPARVKWQVNRWPLIEKRMSRGDCLEWLKRNGHPQPPKSACIGCPLKNTERWRELKANPEEFADAVAVDRAIRSGYKMRGAQYMHFSHQPLEQVDTRSDAEIGQLDLFLNECEGMCGV